MTKAIIYCRVSSKKQINEGNGLESQESICKNWAIQKGYEIVNIYSEPGISGKDIKNRPEIQKMLKFLKTAKEKYTVIAYDTDRISRNTADFTNILNDLYSKGHCIEIPNNKIIDYTTPEGKLVSTIKAATGQFEREKILERSKDNMRAKLKEGYWILKPPIGYFLDTNKTSQSNRHLLPDEPKATIIQSALTKFASAELDTQKDVADFLVQQFAQHNLPIPKNIMDMVKRILTEKKYTGYYSYPMWDIPEIKGHITPIIDLRTFYIIQTRLKQKNRLNNKTYNKNDEEFPLRGILVCPYCGKKLTGSHTKSRKYPYYQCQNKDCPNRKKVNISPKIVHKDFSELLTSISVRSQALELIKQNALRLYNNQIEYKKNILKQKKEEIVKINEQIQTIIQNTFSTKNLDSQTRSIIMQQIQKLNEQKSKMELEYSIEKKDDMPFDQALAAVLYFVTDLADIWSKATLQEKRTILSIVFTDNLYYSKDNKFQNPPISPIFQISDELKHSITNITKIYNFSDKVPDLEKNDEIKDEKNTKSGTGCDPHKSNDFITKTGINNHLVP